MISLSAIRDAFDGISPSAIATVDSAGEVNVSYLSDVHYIDETHIALSFQFFNKTHRNIHENPIAQLVLLHPHTSEKFRITVQYLRTETSGQLFERMRAKLAGIASHHGMAQVFRLLGADVYRVLSVERTPGKALSPPPQPSLMPKVRRVFEALAGHTTSDSLVSALLPALAANFDIHHSMMLAIDWDSKRLYTLDSYGYPTSGVGSEVALGDGVIGVAAEIAAPVRINHMLQENAYSRAVRREILKEGATLEPEIALPGLVNPQSQMAVPTQIGQQIKGVLFVESPKNYAFNHDLEDAVWMVAQHFGALLGQFPDANCQEFDAEPMGPARQQPLEGPALRVRYFPGTATVFLNDEYLIKGVAGAILWKLLREFRTHGRTQFSSRELRLDPSIGLPQVSDNLATRLILLKRRLEERDHGIRLLQGGRGQMQLEVAHPLDLIDQGAA